MWWWRNWFWWALRCWRIGSRTGKASLILRFGTEAQKQKYLPPIARGKTCFAIAMSEPDSGSDLASVRTRAVRSDGGWIVNGSKIWTSNAHRCQAMIALFRTGTPESRQAGLTQFVVDLPTPGVTVNPIIDMAGDHHFNEVVFQDCFLPDDQLLGSEGSGWAQVTSELALERSGPERFMSSMPLLSQMVARADGAAAAGGGWPSCRAPCGAAADVAFHRGAVGTGARPAA